MDLSWCIICDRHCVDNSLYCSETCRFQDNLYHDTKEIKAASTPPSSPELSPFLYSFHNDHRRKTSASNITHITPNNSSFKEYSYFPYRFTPGSPSESSLYADDT